jgi:hypothetical protein
VWFSGYPLSTIPCNSRSENQKVNYIHHNYHLARSRCGAEYAVSRQKVRFKANLLALLTHKTCSQPLLAERLSQSEKSALARPTSLNFVVFALVAACTRRALEHTSRPFHKWLVHIAWTLFALFSQTNGPYCTNTLETQLNPPLRHESAIDPHEGAGWRSVSPSTTARHSFHLHLEQLAVFE